MKIIGFNGTMGAGKSTAIQCLKDCLDNDYSASNVKLVKFAQPLYDIQEMVYRRIESVYARPHSFIKDRKLLQWLGTDWGRDGISQTLWADLWKSDALGAAKKNPHIIIVCDDVRFDNEAQTIKSLGGSIVKIYSNQTQKRIDISSGIAYHASEAGIRKELIDLEVDNNGTRLEFLYKMTEVYKQFGILPDNKRSK